VLPDGSRSTAEHVLTKVDGNKFTWKSQNRTLKINADLGRFGGLIKMESGRFRGITPLS
jgi:hypothetical protein